jgi:hypothetical protein
MVSLLLIIVKDFIQILRFIKVKQYTKILLQHSGLYFFLNCQMISVTHNVILKATYLTALKNNKAPVKLKTNGTIVRSKK